jgi:hypothetical protein
MLRRLKNFLETHGAITEPVLMVLSMVSAYFTFLGARSLFGAERASYLNSASAAVFSIGVTAGIFIFWHMALSIVPPMQSGKTRLLGLAITALGWPFLIALSSWLNVTAMAGGAALDLHMAKSIPAFERAVDDASRSAHLAEKLVPDLKAAADRYAGLAQAERTGGRISGVAGNGGIADTLDGVSRQLGGLRAQISEASRQADAIAAQARASVEKMRTISVSKAPLDGRLEDFAGEADKIKALIGRMDKKGLAESIQRSSAALADSVIERVSSRNAQVAAAQSEALARIREDLAGTGAAIAGVAAQIAAEPAVSAPEFERISVVRAVVRFAGSFLPFWAGGIALDLLPTLLILYLMLAHAVVGPEKDDDENDDRQSDARYGRSGINLAYDRDRDGPHDEVLAGGRFARVLAMLGRMSPKGFAMLAGAVIIALVALDIVSAALPSWAMPDLSDLVGPGHVSRSAPGAGTHCIVMPDGVRVCDPGAGAAGFTGKGSFPNTLALRKPSPMAVRTVGWIVDALGLVPNFEVVGADFDEDQWAYAMIRNGKRYIVYDRRRFQWDRKAPRWEDVAILAHEIGHHLNGHTLDDIGSRPPTELEADRFAGFAISRLGGSLENALAGFRALPKDGSRTHPPRAERLAAVEAGWRHSEALKKQEPVTCATDWLDEPFKVRGRSCRMAKVCRGKTTGYRLACEQGGKWFWTNRSVEEGEAP